MAKSAKSEREELVRELFLSLAPRWDIHDREGALNLARHCRDMAAGYAESLKEPEAEPEPEGRARLSLPAGR